MCMPEMDAKSFIESVQARGADRFKSKISIWEFACRPRVLGANCAAFFSSILHPVMAEQVITR